MCISLQTALQSISQTKRKDPLIAVILNNFFPSRPSFCKAAVIMFMAASCWATLFSIITTFMSGPLHQPVLFSYSNLLRTARLFYVKLQFIFVSVFLSALRALYETQQNNAFTLNSHLRDASLSHHVSHWNYIHCESYNSLVSPGYRSGTSLLLHNEGKNMKQKQWKSQNTEKKKKKKNRSFKKKNEFIFIDICKVIFKKSQW